MDFNPNSLAGCGTEFKFAPQHMDILGAEKYLQVQGYSYYGNIYCKSSTSTVGFIKETKLHLIPFYDLYALKKELEDRYENRLKKHVDKLEKDHNLRMVMKEIQSEKL